MFMSQDSPCTNLERVCYVGETQKLVAIPARLSSSIIIESVQLQLKENTDKQTVRVVNIILIVQRLRFV